jgi:aryl-alcohol dehydrogenase-like predicted oxidoreductase/enamine deaminase RidA (YjgF/YER057c/UK114 family)
MAEAATATRSPDRAFLAPGFDISRVVTGLWQIADMEKDGRVLDLDELADEMKLYAEDGFDTFDVADHYGSAEDIAGRLNRLYLGGAVKSRAPRILTKWCPAPGPVTRDDAEAAVARAQLRLDTDRIDLLQLHWWMFQHPGWIDAMKALTALKEEGQIGHVGTTNFDTDHLRLLYHHGFPVVSNQVSFSLLDRRAADDMTRFCLESGIRILAYGCLAGGLLTDKWHGRPKPLNGEVSDWSTMKYLRFVEEAGGWDVLQQILDALANVARRHGVSIAAVALRWVLEQRAVAAVIVGARLGERQHRADSAQVFGFKLSDDDYAEIDQALISTRPIRGDCGDEYRRPPYLTATGDLRHHLTDAPQVFRPEAMQGRHRRLRVDSGSIWEPIAGFSRAVRIGDRILVSGTTATHGAGEVIAPGSAPSQTVYILDKIRASIEALGGRMENVVTTRIYVRDQRNWEEISRIHGRIFGEIRPVNTLIEVSNLVGDYEVEIEAEAVVE